MLTAEQNILFNSHIENAKKEAKIWCAERRIRGFDEDSAIAAAIRGLMDACIKYNPALPVKFWTYAKLRVRGEILDQSRENCMINPKLRVSTKKYGALPWFENRIMENISTESIFDDNGFYELIRGIRNNRDREIVEMRFGRGMTNIEIAKRFGITNSRISQILTKCMPILKKRHEYLEKQNKGIRNVP